MPDAAPTVRPATIADVQVIAAYNVAMALETEGLSLDAETVRQGVEAGVRDAAKGQYFVAEAGGRVAACLLVTREWSDWRNGDLWWIQSVYVHPEHRRGGLFRALYAHVRQAAITAGVGGLRLYVERENERAQQTYGALGMSLTHYLVMEEIPLVPR